MLEKNNNNRRKQKTDTVPIFNIIIQDDRRFFEEQDNGWSLTCGIFLFLVFLTGLWVYTTFSPAVAV